MIVGGVIGWPVSHSLSPRLHGFWLREHQIPGSYIPLPARGHEFSTVLRGLRLAGIAGVNVTIPHKQAALAVANTCDDASRAAGAANFLRFRGDRIDAGNFDVEGFEACLLAEIGAGAIRERRAIILGAGGAARACVLGCDRLHVGAIHILNRTRGRAEAVVAALAPFVSAKLFAGSLEDWPGLAAVAHLLVNATSAGLAGTASVAIALEFLPRDAIVCDIVYEPLETPLLARARSCGLRTVNGLGMLMHQAVPAFEMLFGTRPEITPAVRRHLEQALAQ